MFQGPGEIDHFQAALVGRQWTILINVSEDKARDSWPGLEDLWRKRNCVTAYLSQLPGGRTDPDELTPDASVSATDFEARLVTDDIRPGRRMLMVETAQHVIGIGPGSQPNEPPSSDKRSLILDASWTHVSSFPEREQVRSYMSQVLALATRPVHFISDLDWDLSLFRAVAKDHGKGDLAREGRVAGSISRKLWQSRQYLKEIEPGDTVLIALVPGRDDRGALQRLRSEIAERTSSVKSFPTAPLSTGPGISRDEALEALGLWLPTFALVGSGPISEQVLLARYLNESSGGSPVEVAVSGGEYRLPEFELLRHVDTGRRAVNLRAQRAVASRSGLVVVTYGQDEDAVSLSGTGLPEQVEDVLPRIRVSRRGKSPEQVVREIEMAFSSRGLPLPAVRYLS